MSSTPTINSAGSAAGAAATAATTSNAIPANMQISESGFLQLISTQLQNQNPLQPTDPTQFLSQLEGMSEVSSLQSMQTSMAGLSSTLQASQVLSGTSLLGHMVLAPGSTATLPSGGTVTGAVNAPSGASALLVSVTDASGALVKSFAVAPQSSGLTYFTWDGTTSTGQAAPAGQYTVNVTAGVGGSSQSVSPMIASKVDSVTLDPSTQSLDLNTDNGTVALSAVVSVM
jgi:flagellar basal-body rod modification protein FlgD